MNKRAMLLAKTVVGIVIALIAIGILIYFLVSLYYNSVKDKELEQAKATLNRLVEEINAGAEGFDVISGIGNQWSLVSFPSKDKNSNACSSWEKCLCICREQNTFEAATVPSCEKGEGICVENEYVVEEDSLTSYNKINLAEPMKLKINRENKIISM